MGDVLGHGGRWCHALSNTDALQMYAHQNVGQRLPITSAFSASSLPSVLGGSLGWFGSVYRCFLALGGVLSFWKEGWSQCGRDEHSLYNSWGKKVPGDVWQDI